MKVFHEHSFSILTAKVFFFECLTVYGIVTTYTLCIDANIYGLSSIHHCTQCALL